METWHLGTWPYYQAYYQDHEFSLGLQWIFAKVLNEIYWDWRRCYLILTYLCWKMNASLIKYLTMSQTPAYRHWSTARYSAAVKMLEHWPDFVLAKYTPYPVLMGELWGAYCMHFFRNNVVLQRHSVIQLIQWLHDRMSMHKLLLMPASTPQNLSIGQGWGLLSQFPPFPYFPNFSEPPKHMLAIEYHVYIWQVSLQLSCGDTCQIWMWLK